MRFATRRALQSFSMSSCLFLLAVLVIGMGTVSGMEDLKLKAERSLDGTVRLTWRYLEDPAVDRYVIYWDTEEFDVVGAMEPEATVRGNTFSPDDLENDVRYYFAVTAIDGNGTVLTEGFDDITPREPHLKVVNYPVLMVILILHVIVFILVLMKVPEWTEEIKGGA